MSAPRKKDKISVEYREKHYPEYGERRERNEQLIRDYINDMSIVEMVGKYKISWQRITQILKKYRRN